MCVLEKAISHHNPNEPKFVYCSFLLFWRFIEVNAIYNLSLPFFKRKMLSHDTTKMQTTFR